MTDWMWGVRVAESASAVEMMELLLTETEKVVSIGF